MTHDEHLKWAKDRALEYVDNGRLDLAVASMLSDLQKSDQPALNPVIGQLGLLHVMNGDRASVVHWIEGFD